MSLQVQKSFNEQSEHLGKLYLVGTPIGNLEDMTFRAIKTLQSCDIIAAEDTRQTRKLLTHFEITPSMLFSYHEHNKGASGPELIRYIIEGKIWHWSVMLDYRLFQTLVLIWSSLPLKQESWSFQSLVRMQHYLP